MAASARARLIIDAKRVFRDGAILQVRVHAVPEPVQGSSHEFKYQLFYGFAGRRLVLYDNESGKGDHRHYGDVEQPYPFTGVRRLMNDFLSDVRRLRGRFRNAGANAMSEIKVDVGESLEQFGERVAEAWTRAEAGELTATDPERRISFEDFATFASIMTPKRLALLRHIHRQPARSIRSLSQAVGRDYRRVHDDVEALVSAGLVERGPDGLTADYDEVRVETRIAL